MRGATSFLPELDGVISDFYSRASCEARLDVSPYCSADSCNFYSRASCEARHAGAVKSCLIISFLLTRLMRGATNSSIHSMMRSIFLLTRLMRGATRPRQPTRPPKKHFYSRASCEARHQRARQLYVIFSISTHAPHARRDHAGRRALFPSTSFLLTRLMRGATPKGHKKLDGL